MPLSASEKAAIITVAGNWALSTVEEASGGELVRLLKAGGGKMDNILITSFLEHYEQLTDALESK